VDLARWPVVRGRLSREEGGVKGIMFTSRGKAEIIDEPMPECAPETVLLRTICSGLSNGTERSFLVGGPYGKSRWPSRIAYQSVSEVVERGESITRFDVGDVVYTGTFPGHVEYHLARESDLIVKLPDGLDRREAAFLGVLSVSLHNAKRVAVSEGESCLVTGAGLIGQFAAQVCRVMGGRVTVSDRDERRLALAAELGAEATALAGTPEGTKAVEDRAPYAVALECSGADVLAWIIGRRMGEGLLARPSRLALVAGRFEVRYDCGAAQGRAVAIYHSTHFVQEDLEEAVGLLADGRVRASPLIRDVVPAGQAPGVYDRLRDDPQGLLGTVFEW
jgi:3-hydroxyethyl bacteriochlorophyllide a dehydrogenase